MNPFAQFLLKDFSGKLHFIHIFFSSCTLRFSEDIKLINKLIKGLPFPLVYVPWDLLPDVEEFSAVIIHNYLCDFHLQSETLKSIFEEMCVDLCL